uniref:Uncharacterized protein n=1 Tax=Arundo donax TaxID=35708 RepID=A0A0A9EAT0_ARUDO
MKHDKNSLTREPLKHDKSFFFIKSELSEHFTYIPTRTESGSIRIERATSAASNNNLLDAKPS